MFRGTRLTTRGAASPCSMTAALAPGCWKSGDEKQSTAWTGGRGPVCVEPSDAAASWETPRHRSRRRLCRANLSRYDRRKCKVVLRGIGQNGPDHFCIPQFRPGSQGDNPRERTHGGRPCAPIRQARPANHRLIYGSDARCAHPARGLPLCAPCPLFSGLVKARERTKRGPGHPGGCGWRPAAATIVLGGLDIPPPNGLGRAAVSSWVSKGSTPIACAPLRSREPGGRPGCRRHRRCSGHAPPVVRRRRGPAPAPALRRPRLRAAGTRAGPRPRFRAASRRIPIALRRRAPPPASASARSPVPGRR